MSHERTWNHRERSVEDCRQVLRASDERTLERRAGRLSILGQIETMAGDPMPDRTWHLLSEADDCFTDGRYTACILVLATGVEHGLRELCGVRKRVELAKLIQKGVNNGKIKECEAMVLQALKDYRNRATHSNMNELARGKTLQRQRAYLTESGLSAASEWEEMELVSQDDKEIAVNLAAEREIGEILVGVRHALHDIFDRHRPPSQDIAPTIDEM